MSEPASKTIVPDRADLLLISLGRHVQRLRKEAGLTQQELSQRTGVSVRFLSQLEAGRNVSVTTLCSVAAALSQRTSQLLQAAEAAQPETLGDPGRVVALIGLRGAGKSTIGRRVAQGLGRPFVELDEHIEEAAGLHLAEIFALHGEAYYRRLEHETLRRLLAGDPVARPVVATGGGLVTEPETYALLRRYAITVWLKATPEDHWNRVVQQGDQRPMAGDSLSTARAQLEELHRARAPLYQQALLTVDTSALGIDGAVALLRQHLR